MYSPMVGVAVVVAFAPEERTFFARTCAVLFGSRDEALVTERLADGVVVVVGVVVRDASEFSPSDGRELARHNAASLFSMHALSDLSRVLCGSRKTHKHYAVAKQLSARRFRTRCKVAFWSIGNVLPEQSASSVFFDTNSNGG